MSLKSVKFVNVSQEADPTNEVFFIDASSGSIELTLCSITNDGVNFYIKRVDSTLSNTVTIKGYDNNQTIFGLHSIVLSNSNDYIIVVSYNNKWM